MSPTCQLCLKEVGYALGGIEVLRQLDRCQRWESIEIYPCFWPRMALGVCFLCYLVYKTTEGWGYILWWQLCCLIMGVSGCALRIHPCWSSPRHWPTLANDSRSANTQWNPWFSNVACLHLCKGYYLDSSFTSSHQSWLLPPSSASILLQPQPAEP